MAATDPTYPLYPLLCLVCAALLAVIMITSVTYRSLNRAAAFLCFWLFLENMTQGIDAIIWSDNADIKLAVWCDIVTRVQLATSIVKPASTLLIARWLYLIASHKVVETNLQRRVAESLITWTLGLGLPLLVAGPLYYIVQSARFDTLEVFGCATSIIASGATILLVQSWTIILPLIAIVIYYPKVIWVFYSHNKDSRDLLSHNSTSRSLYLRVLALGCFDLLLVFPFNVIGLIVGVRTYTSQLGPLPFYQGWASVHALSWAPQSAPYDELREGGLWALVELYLPSWTAPVLGLSIVALFGLTADARATYKRWAAALMRSLGMRLPLRGSQNLEEIAFSSRSGGREVTLELRSSSPGEHCSEDRREISEGKWVAQELALDTDASIRNHSNPEQRMLAGT